MLSDTHVRLSFLLFEWMIRYFLTQKVVWQVFAWRATIHGY